MSTPRGEGLPGPPRRDDRSPAPGEEGIRTAAAASGVRASLESSPWAPLRQRMFAWLWVGVLISGMGTWMQTLGAQWLLVDSPNAAAVVALVQVANTLPVMVLSVPAGVLADSFDKRWLLFAVQVYFLLAGASLLVLTLAGHMPPSLLLVFTLLLGVGAAVQLPAWQASTPELVPRHQIRSAARLEMVGVNVSRAAGPALAGLVIAQFGVAAVFALNALSVIPLGIALLFWHRRPSRATSARERFWPALRAGGRYAWHDTDVRRVLLRLAVFLLPASALWALLPLVATRLLGVGAGGYGVMFAALGLGAIAGALVLGRVRRVLSTNATLTAAGLLMATTLLALVVVQGFAAALLILVAAGLAWTTTISTLVGELQLFLPGWVMARGMAIWTMVFTGCQALGAVLWGLVANQVDLFATFVVTAVLAAAAAGTGLIWRVPDASADALDPLAYWGEARVALTPDPSVGPVQIAVTYTVAPEREPQWLDAMGEMRRSRLRSGATRWELYRDAEHRDRFVEQFWVSTWEEHLRQHEGRLTARDQAIEQLALSFSDPPATAVHLLPP
ncbi:putative MFS family arabinose efflux permease [Humibacillus xanthopallidus]|uniref:Putative MFS family arabinose efflux permease n=1 Tax=Humibacillus xanthopallidus TaxID=412689 RepID=A0A543PLX8_9MICO|nr:MFS transporter [Humibacillus xanthopallidus]TQN45076.1 putative MFS family arabinose efflux permease [Humibacillus xanthopallidus]